MTKNSFVAEVTFKDEFGKNSRNIQAETKKLFLIKKLNM